VISINISNEKLIEIVSVLNYSRSLLNDKESDKEPNEIIDSLNDVIYYLDNLIIDGDYDD